MSVEICGVVLKNPVVAASGTFGFGEEYANTVDFTKIGGIALKALTRVQRDGNPTPRIAETACGILNSVGLQNPGVDAFLDDIYPRIAKYDTALIANIAGECESDYLYVTERLNETDIPLYEVNVSCPNVKKGGISFGTNPGVLKSLICNIKKVSAKPVIVKLTPNVTDIIALACAAADGGADALSLVNTFTGMKVDAATRRPILANITGGLSGPAIKPIALRMVYQVYCSGIGLPIIGMGGIMSGEDAAEFLICGANAVMAGTATLCDPCALPEIATELESFCENQNIKSVRALTGTLKV